MTSEHQIAANRLNAQKSTGPQTPEGRAAVRLNSVKHGLSAETLVLAGEDESEFTALHDALRHEHRPATPTEDALVRQLAMAIWRQIRLFHTEGAFLSRGQKREAAASPDTWTQLAFALTRDSVSANMLSKLSRYEARLERSIRAALEQLARLRAQRPTKNAKQTQSEPVPPPFAPIAIHEMPACPPEEDVQAASAA